MSANSSPEWVGLSELLERWRNAIDGAEKLAHGHPSPFLEARAEWLRECVHELEATFPAIAQHIERVKREARLDEARRVEVVIEAESSYEPISGDGVLGILQRKVRRRIAELEKQP